ncbi:MAG: CPBP family intramembrane metalloprotease [Elusimicrobiota bacterium]|nr:CPBP family intramembrane metalloprotease [Elusimicrobiota bacterium]
MAALIALAAYGLRRLVYGRVPKGVSGFCGWYLPPRAAWSVVARWVAPLVLVLFVVEFSLVMRWDELRALTHSQVSPAWRIAALGFSPATIAMAVLYAFFQTGLAEEILFRGLIAKRLIAWLGFRGGNLLQATLFAVMHNGMVLFAAPGASIQLHLMIFISPFFLGYLAGYLNEKPGEGSIVPSWIVHGAGNFAGVLAQMLVISR